MLSQCTRRLCASADTRLSRVKDQSPATREGTDLGPPAVRVGVSSAVPPLCTKAAIAAGLGTAATSRKTRAMR
jgi:hypothetical protein